MLLFALSCSTKSSNHEKTLFVKNQKKLPCRILKTQRVTKREIAKRMMVMAAAVVIRIAVKAHLAAVERNMTAAHVNIITAVDRHEENIKAVAPIKAVTAVT